MKGRINILLSIPIDFIEKFTHFVNNVNALNSDKETPVVVEKIYYDDIEKEDPVESKAERKLP